MGKNDSNDVSGLSAPNTSNDVAFPQDDDDGFVPFPDDDEDNMPPMEANSVNGGEVPLDSSGNSLLDDSGTKPKRAIKRKAPKKRAPKTAKRRKVEVVEKTELASDEIRAMLKDTSVLWRPFELGKNKPLTDRRLLLERLPYSILYDRPSLAKYGTLRPELLETWYTEWDLRPREDKEDSIDQKRAAGETEELDDAPVPNVEDDEESGIPREEDDDDMPPPMDDDDDMMPPMDDHSLPPPEDAPLLDSK